MKRLFIGLALIATASLTVIAPAQESPTFSTNRVWRPLKSHPNGGHTVRFTPIGRIRKAKALRDADPQFDHTKFAAPVLPIDWASKFTFDMYGNDQYGDCYLAAQGHHFDTLSFNNGIMKKPSLGTFSTNGTGLLNRYRILSGGDNGLSDPDVQNEGMNRYCADITDDKYASWAQLDVTNPTAVQTAIYNYGAIYFTLAVPNAWINNSEEGSVWDAPATANPANGHAIIFNGVRSNGDAQLITWAMKLWITQAGIKVCDPSGWVAWSPKWFNSATGYAPNGIHVSTSAASWLAATGKTIPASVISSFPPVQPTPVPPTPTPVPPTPVPPTPVPPTPTPGVTTLSISKALAAGSYEIVPAGTAAKVQELYSLMQPSGNSGQLKASPAKDDRMNRIERMLNTQSEAILGLQKAILGPQVAPIEPKKTSRIEAVDPYEHVLRASRDAFARLK